MFSETFLTEARALLDAARDKNIRIATAESCTGGLLAGLLTEIPGSSDVMERGFVTYSNDAKMELLGVKSDLILAHGAVSEQVARAMAEGALKNSRAELAIAITGIAGPGGGSAEKPVGLVYLAAAREGGVAIARECRIGDIGRDQIRLRSVAEALTLLRENL